MYDKQTIIVLSNIRDSYIFIHIQKLKITLTRHIKTLFAISATAVKHSTKKPIQQLAIFAPHFVIW